MAPFGRIYIAESKRFGQYTNPCISEANYTLASDDKRKARVEPAEPLGRFGRPSASQTLERTAYADSPVFLPFGNMHAKFGTRPASPRTTHGK